MKNKNFVKIAVVLLLCVAMVLPFVPLKADAVLVTFDPSQIGENAKGKKISILGDSISTFEGVSNDANANSTIGGNAVYYEEDNEYGVTRADTWWQQIIDMFGLKLCVNNSWSGSRVHNAADGKTPSANANYFAWYSRATQLHNATSGNPDYIAVYMGTNDLKDATSYKGFKANQSAIITEAAKLSNTSYNPTYHFSAYVRMVDNMLAKYTSAEIYLFTLLPHESQNDLNIAAMETYNQSIRDLVTYYQGKSKKVYLVDLYAATGITSDYEVLNKHLANTLHPNAAGMDVITNCLASAMAMTKTGNVMNPANWREVVYDLQDVYVEGGQINAMRFSSSSKTAFSVGLLPTRSECDLEVKVQLHKMGAGTAESDFVDITSEAYSGGTVYIYKAISYSTYDYVKITAKSVYKPKNFRWELKDGSLESLSQDGKLYDTKTGITYNDATLIKGSYTSNLFSKAQYQLSDSILLRNEEPWVLEWKVKGPLTSDNLFFSGDELSGARNNNYVFYNYDGENGAQLYLGHRNNYKSKYWNYGVAIPAAYIPTADTAHTFRLVNQINDDGSNMVHLLIDGDYVGEMKNFCIDTAVQTGSLATQNWLNGRDLEFNFLGADSAHLLNSCSIEYIQVWEGGEFDTLRLEQLLMEYNDLYRRLYADTDFRATGFYDYYVEAVAADDFLNSPDYTMSQEKIDSFVANILAARNNLKRDSATTKIYSAELLTRNYVSIGKPAGLKIITTPDVTSVSVGTQTLITNSSELQKMTIDGVETEVKVWLVTWKRSYTSQKRISYTIKATGTATASKSIEIPFGANCLAYIKMTKEPTKTTYFAGEKFDATGMEITAYYGDGTQSKKVTNFSVTTSALKSTDTYVTVSYTETDVGTVEVNIPIKVLTNVSDLDNCAVGDEIIVRGYYVGVAEEGNGGDKEILLKDLESDDVIALRGLPGDFIDNDLNYGYELEIAVTVGAESSSHADTPNKRYITYSETRNRSVATCLVSTGKQPEFSLDNVVSVTGWEEMQAELQVGTIQPYTFVELTGPLYLASYTGSSDGVYLYRTHMNASAKAAADLKCGARVITLRDNVMTKNLGANWLDLLVDSTSGINAYPGAKANVHMYALYTGAHGGYAQLTILSADWIEPLA